MAFKMQLYLLIGPQLVSLYQVYAFFPEEVLSTLRTIFLSLLVKLIIGKKVDKIHYIIIVLLL